MAIEFRMRRKQALHRAVLSGYEVLQGDKFSKASSPESEDQAGADGLEATSHVHTDL